MSEKRFVNSVDVMEWKSLSRVMMILSTKGAKTQSGIRHFQYQRSGRRLCKEEVSFGEPFSGDKRKRKLVFKTRGCLRSQSWLWGSIEDWVFGFQLSQIVRNSGANWKNLWLLSRDISGVHWPSVRRECDSSALGLGARQTHFFRTHEMENN